MSQTCPGIAVSLVIISVAFLIGYFKNSVRINSSWPFLLQKAKFDMAALIAQGTSVSCRGYKHTNRQCHFTNLCYLPQYRDFVFLRSENSKYVNFPRNRFNPALLDLSTVEDHNQHYFDFVDIPSAEIEQFLPEIEEKVTLIFNRFLPSNLMHALHDDVIPAFYTLKTIAEKYGFSGDDVKLVFMDDNPEHEFEILYEILSKHAVATKVDILERNRTICFRDLHVGVAKDTLWYQYGFRTFQGALTNAMTLPPEFLAEFTDFVISKMEIEMKENDDYLVLLSRKDNRLILNEFELMMRLSKIMKIRTISLEDHDLREMIGIIRKSKGMIGMHGSLLSLAIFLPPQAAIIELFPFGILPERYTPYKTLSQIPGLNIVYRSWANQNEQKSIAHPDWEPEFGGIEHLSLDEQREIKDQNTVPAHLCCKDSNWLYRIYQDTIVNVEEINELLQDALKESKAGKVTLYPGEVRGIECSKGEIHWQEPWNLASIKKSSDAVKYEVWVQKHNSQNFDTFFTRERFLKVENFIESMDYSIWIRCHLDDAVGPFNGHKTCSFSR